MDVWCEFQRQQEAGVITNTRIPSMIYISAAGEVVETTQGVVEQADLEAKLLALRDA